jgi:putative flippase GtrA
MSKIQQARDFLHPLLAGSTTSGKVQFFRYGIVAAIAFAFDFGLLYVFERLLDWNYLLAATTAFIISLVVNYFLTTLWAFPNRTKRQRSVELVLFLGICFVAVLLTDIFMWIFTSLIGYDPLISKLITVVIVFFWSFGARRYVFQSDFLNQEWVSKIVQKTAKVLNK